MAELTIVFLGLALAHYIFDQILAPTFRTAIRYRMFALRDKLRTLKYEKDAQFSNRAFDLINEGINTHIQMQEQIDFFLLYKFNKEKQKNPQFRKQVEGQWKTINECQLKEVVEIVGELGNLQTQVAVVNNFTFFLCIIPALLFAAFFVKIVRGFRSLAISPLPSIEERGLDSKTCLRV